MQRRRDYHLRRTVRAHRIADKDIREEYKKKIKDAISQLGFATKRRIEKLQEEERWAEGDSTLHLPKVAHRKSHAGRKEAKEEAETEVVAVEAETETTQEDSN